MNLDILTALGNDPAKVLVNLIDILIVSYLIYRILLVIRGTRAEQLLKGVFILLLISAIARWTGLSSLNWLLEKVWTGFFIALPVVFQPELRRALEQLGRGQFFGQLGDKARENEANLDEVIKAVSDLSKQKIGALIIWTREIGLKDFEDIGVSMDSMISQELLMNIFMPKSPLHDGAVVINRGRIEKAGVCLPLSDNLNLGKHLGTRHRAAVGITEVSDALAVVVSEESGTISIAQSGKLTRFLTEKDLRSILLHELRAQTKTQKKSWAWWRHSNGTES